MKIKLLDVERYTRGLPPVTSTELKTRTGDLSPDGLFSETIFGISESLDRSKKFSYINLNANVIHPTAYKLLIRIDRRIELFLSTEKDYSLNFEGELIEDENGVSGIEEFMKIFPRIKLKGGTDTRDKIINVLKESYRTNVLFITKLIIIPPNFRPMYEAENGKTTLDELNNVYINIMRKASQVKGVGKGSPLFNLLNFYLQRAVNDHDAYVKSKISKKHGLIRNNLLGKRVDFSARGVIVPGPKLDINQVGLPLRMAVELFKPFLIHHFLFKKYPFKEKLEYEVKKFTENELSVDSVNRVIKAIKLADEVPIELYNLFFEAAEIVMKGRVVILKRDPALHAGSYRAFYPVLINGNVIQLSTTQVGSFNADFDGDQMGVFHPLSRQAQEEARTKMTRAVGANFIGHVNYEISKEMLVGLYIMTKEIKRSNSPYSVTPEILEKATDPYIQVKFKNQITTMGRAIFNSVFPPNFKFIDNIVDKKVVKNLIPLIITEYGEDEASRVFSKLGKVGFKFATIMAPSFTINDLEMPDSILQLKKKLENSTPAEAGKILKEAEKIMIEYLKDTGLYDLTMSGAGKGWDQLKQILVAKGIAADPKGNILPTIKGSFSEGLSATEYFTAGSAARKGMADRALSTATTGYFTRQLVYVLGPVEASPNIRDCNTKRTITLRLTKDYLDRLEGRYIQRGNNVVQIIRSNHKPGDVIRLRSPILCETKKICHTCYGNLLKVHKTPYIGILAGSLIGERGTQLIMRTFHTGGAATISIKDIIQDIIDNDPLIVFDMKQYLSQDDDKLITKKPCKLSIDLTSYEMNNNIQVNTDHVWVNHLIARVEYSDNIFNIILDYPVKIRKNKIEIIEKSSMTFEFEPNDIMLDVPMQVTDMKEQVNYVGRLLGGKIIYKDPSHFIGKVMKVYGGSISDLDLTHFEVLISQVLRNRSNLLLPARLGKTWDPVLLNIKNAVFESGFIQGLAFENINKAIEYGIIAEEDVEPSLLGKLVTGEIIK